MEKFIHVLFEADYREITWWAMTIRGAIIYLLAIILFRIGGKRMLSNYGSFDIVISIMLGALLAKAIAGNAKFFPTIITALIMVGMHRIITIATEYHHPTGKLIKGKPKILYQDGNFLKDDMKQHGITENDILEAMRIEAKTKDISKVDEVYLERNGRISITLL